MRLKTLLASLLISGSAIAGPTEFTVTHAPGGPSDTTTRLLVKTVGNNEFTVVNRPGAGGTIAIKHLLNEKTVLVATMSQIYVTNPMLFPNLDYSPDSDLELIGVVASMPSVLVCNANKNINSISDLIVSKPLNFGVAGYGSSEHLATEVLFKKLKTAHMVIPYSKGGSAAVQDMLGGNIDCMFANYPVVSSWVDNSRLKFIMSSHDLGLKLPTWKVAFAEPFPFESYLGLVVARSMNEADKEALKAKFVRAFASKELATALSKVGLFPVLGIDKKSVEVGLYNNTKLKVFILQNAIKISN